MTINKPWMVLPLALHCTFFDFIFWSLTWNPSSYFIISQISAYISTQSPFLICEDDNDYKLNSDEVEYDVQMIVKGVGIV